MKKLLSILGAIGLTATSTTSLISCQKPNNNENEEINKPEQPPENSNWELVDNISNEDATKNKDKYYFVIYQNKNENNWKTYKLQMGKENDMPLFDGSKNLKAFYRWDSNGDPQTPTINPNTGKIKDWKD